MTHLSVEMVPPPDEAPEYEEAKSLGLLSCLRVETRDRMSRCCQCSTLRPPGSHIVWVPDHIRLSDPAWAVIEACRSSAFNGHFSGWCIKCARKLGGVKVAPKSAAEISSRSSEDSGFVYGFLIGTGVGAILGTLIAIFIAAGPLHG